MLASRSRDEAGSDNNSSRLEKNSNHTKRDNTERPRVATNNRSGLANDSPSEMPCLTRGRVWDYCLIG